MAIPTKDSLLVPFSTNFNTRINATPVVYGTTAPAALAYTALHDPFVAAYNALIAAREAHIRSSPLAQTKDDAKRNLLRYARWMYKNIQANSAVTDTSKTELGIRVPDVSPTPQPVPSFAPKLSVESVNGRLVRILLTDPAHPTRKRMPDGCNGATVMSFVGPTAPETPAGFKYEGSTAKTTIEVLFPETVEPGAQAWLIAFFFNERKQNGPACTAVPVTINYPASMPMAA